MDASKNFDHTRSISNKAEDEVALKHIDSFISFKTRELKLYGNIIENTPYANIKHNVSYVMEKEEECLREAKELRDMLKSGQLGEFNGENAKRDMQLYDHIESQALERVDENSLTDILKAALKGDKDIIDMLELIRQEYVDTTTMDVAGILIDSVIRAKNAITGLLYSMEEW